MIFRVLLQRKFSLQVNCLSRARVIRSNFMSGIINYDLWNFNRYLLRVFCRSWDQSGSKPLTQTWSSGSLASLQGFGISMYSSIFFADVLWKAYEYIHTYVCAYMYTHTSMYTSKYCSFHRFFIYLILVVITDLIFNMFVFCKGTTSLFKLYLREGMV